MRLASASACSRPIGVSMRAVGAPLSFTSLMLCTGTNGLSASLMPSSVTLSGRLPITIRMVFSHPGLQQCIGDRENHRPDENADQAAGNQPAAAADEDQEQRRCGAT